MLVFGGVYKNPGDDEPVSWVVDPDARRKGNWMACWNALLLRRRWVVEQLMISDFLGDREGDNGTRNHCTQGWVQRFLIFTPTWGNDVI